jgi:hypothetical protein
MMKMIHIVAALSILGAVFSQQLLADHVPPVPGGVVELEGNARLFLKYNNFTPLLDIEGRWEDENLEFRYHALTVGGYYRVHKNIKVGAFYRLQRGARHDDDWIDLNPGWEWQDTLNRNEHVLIFDFSPRFQLDFIPGKNWVFMLKNRYLFNTFNNQHTVKVRPGLTYFLIVDRAPLLNFSVNYDLYIPLNYGETFLYGQWPYIDVLYHATEQIKITFSAAYKNIAWSTSQDAKDGGESHYTVNYKAFVLGAGLIFYLNI